MTETNQALEKIKNTVQCQPSASVAVGDKCERDQRFVHSGDSTNPRGQCALLAKWWPWVEVEVAVWAARDHSRHRGVAPLQEETGELVNWGLDYVVDIL